MKQLNAILFVFLFTSVSAQITVDRSYMPKAGDKVFYTNAEIGNDKTYETKGANVTWDYSNLELAFQDAEEYKSARSINFFFLTMDFGVKVADSLGFGQFMMRDIYDVYNVTNGAFKAEGRSLKYNGFPIPQNYSDDDEIYQFPLNYGDVDTSTFKVSFSLAGQLSLVQQGTRINDVDGWGTLKLPNKTYNNCIKVKTFIDELDSMKFMGITFPFPNRRMEYKWFAPGKKNPVLIITGSLLGNRLTITNVKYQDDEKEVLGFYATKKELVESEITNLNDTSIMSGIFRQWEITPNTYTLEAGSNLGDSSVSISFNAVGKYTVQLTKRNRFGTKTVSKTDYINVKKKEENTGGGNGETSVFENQDLNKFHLFPNPFSDRLMVVGSMEIKSLRLINQLGKTVISADGSSQLIGLEDLPSGVYFFEIEGGNDKFFERVLKQ